MGVVMRLYDQNFKIRAEHKEDALQEIKELMDEEDHTPTDKAFSWLNGVNPKKWETLEDALRDWRFKPKTNDEGDIVELQFTGQKIGDEAQMFEKIRHYVEEGSYLEFGYPHYNSKETDIYRFKNGQVIHE